MTQVNTDITFCRGNGNPKYANSEEGPAHQLIAHVRAILYGKTGRFQQTSNGAD